MNPQILLNGLKIISKIRDFNCIQLKSPCFFELDY